jgi:hypothetical protein
MHRSSKRPASHCIARCLYALMVAIVRKRTRQPCASSASVTSAVGQRHASAPLTALIVYPRKRPSKARMANADAIGSTATVTPDSAWAKMVDRSAASSTVSPPSATDMATRVGIGDNRKGTAACLPDLQSWGGPSSDGRGSRSLKNSSKSVPKQQNAGMAGRIGGGGRAGPGRRTWRPERLGCAHSGSLPGLMFMS